MPLRSCETGKAPRYPGTLGTYAPNQQPPPMDYRYSYPEPLRESPPQRSSSAPLVQAHPAEYRVPRTTSNPLPSRAKETVTAVREPLLDRAERILSSLPPRLEAHAPTTCDTCRRHFEGLQKPDTAAYQASGSLDDSHPGRHIHMHDSELPMQTVVTRALRDLEEDFAVHKR